MSDWDAFAQGIAPGLQNATMVYLAALERKRQEKAAAEAEAAADAEEQQFLDLLLGMPGADAGFMSPDGSSGIPLGALEETDPATGRTYSTLPPEGYTLEQYPDTPPLLGGGQPFTPETQAIVDQYRSGDVSANNLMRILSMMGGGAYAEAEDATLDPDVLGMIAPLLTGADSSTSVMPDDLRGLMSALGIEGEDELLYAMNNPDMARLVSGLPSMGEENRMGQEVYDARPLDMEEILRVLEMGKDGYTEEEVRSAGPRLQDVLLQGFVEQETQPPPESRWMQFGSGGGSVFDPNTGQLISIPGTEPAFTSGSVESRLQRSFEAMQDSSYQQRPGEDNRINYEGSESIDCSDYYGCAIADAGFGDQYREVTTADVGNGDLFTPIGADDLQAGDAVIWTSPTGSKHMGLIMDESGRTTDRGVSDINEWATPYDIGYKVDGFYRPTGRVAAATAPEAEARPEFADVARWWGSLPDDTKFQYSREYGEMSLDPPDRIKEALYQQYVAGSEQAASIPVENTAATATDIDNADGYYDPFIAEYIAAASNGEMPPWWEEATPEEREYIKSMAATQVAIAYMNE